MTSKILLPVKHLHFFFWIHTLGVIEPTERVKVLVILLALYREVETNTHVIKCINQVIFESFYSIVKLKKQ